MLLAGCPGQRHDFRLGQPEVIAPALDVQPWRPALPPAGQGSGIEAQCCQHVSEKLIRDRRAGLRALLLLYRFT